MNKATLLAFTTLFFLLIFGYTNAQTGTVKGIVKDTTSYPRVENALAIIIGKQDSVLKCFTRSKKDGTFILNNIPYGNYVLMITHPVFGDYAEEVSITDTLPEISKDFYLIQKSILINEVIVQRQREVKINGDTTEFNASNYKLLENASAEDLLKLLPGIKVDKDGKITAYGEPVKKVYVDGEEFFSDDPTVATKNIKAEMIDKVQVYDKKNDQEIITGVDDGEKNNVINLKLKDEFKKGFFGKVKAGGGLPSNYDGAAMINVFHDKRKVTGYVTTSNIGNNSLDWSDRRNYGSTPDNVMSDDGYYYTYYSNEDDILDGNEGISNSVIGGTNYNDKLLNNKLGLNAGYTYNNGNRTIGKTTNTQQIINDSTYFKNERENYKANLIAHKPNARIIFDADSNNKFTYSINMNSKSIDLVGSYYSENLNSINDTVNNSFRNISQTDKSQNIKQEFFASHRFKKKGRSISINASMNVSTNNKVKFIDTRQQYFSNGVMQRKDTLNQKNDGTLSNTTTVLKASFTESLGKKWSLEVHYKPTFNTNKSEIVSSLKGLSGEYLYKIDTLSNNFIYDANKQEAGFSLRYFKKKLNATVSINGEAGELRRIDLINSINNSIYPYTAINPTFQLRYTFKNSANFNLRYSGNNNQPQINQLQPIKDYSNPLSINIGNPNLKPYYAHRVNVFMHKYSIQHSRYYYVNVSYNYNQHPFTQKSTFSKEGVTKYFTINGDNTSSVYSWSEIGRNFFKDLIRASLQYSLSSYNNNSFLNDIKNTSKSLNQNIGCDLAYSKEKVFNIRLNYRFSYDINTNKSTISTSTNIIGHSIGAGGKVNFLKHFYIDADYSFLMNKSNTPAAKPYQLNTLNASAGYKFLKNKAELSLLGRNLFNQNNGYDIYQSASTITRTQHNVLGRFLLLDFTYNFANKGSLKKEANDDDDY